MHAIDFRRAAANLREHAVYLSEDRDRARKRGDEGMAMALGWRRDECLSLAETFERADSQPTAPAVKLGARAVDQIARALIRASQPLL